ncbi:hypothetical protein N431DRAFT_427133 [Stipitochalara longipes BDJ]|nr:hypothetical protein N431DRAFT_427133 [Stipitochalara longipes BDJ]
MDIPLSNLHMPPTNSLQQPRIGQFEPRNIWQQDIPRVSAAPQVQYRPPFEPAPQFHRSFETSLHQARPQNSASRLPTTPINATTSSSRAQTVPSQNFNTTSQAPPNLVSHPQGLHAQNRRILTSPSPPQATFQPPPPAPSDLLRKPSLYKIPAWPTSPEVRPAQISTSTSQFQSRPSGSYIASSAEFRSAPTFGSVQQPPNSMQHEKHPIRNFDNKPSSVTTNASSSISQTTAAKTHTFQVPQARIGRKHCPNLIVDIAETCQDLFPFAEVAERHSVPIKRVFDTFSAIIQLPLLRNADDRRRHGSLGKQRMREYRDARKAMEKAEEAGRKAEMRALRARVEEAGKKGKGQANPSPLLKTAILNNANYSNA